MGKALYLALIAAAIALAQTLPLVEVRDWNDRPLPNVTVVVFSPDGKVLAAVKTDQQGRIPTPLPKGIVRVAWGNGWELYQRTGRPEYVIWIYDQAISRDVVELGDASTSAKIRTYVYPLTVTVYDEAGKPQAGLYVEVRDAATNGELVRYAGRTNTDGVAGPFNGPATSYYYFVYDKRGALVAEGKFEIQRGASVPATGWNVGVKVASISQVEVKNGDVVRGFIVVRGVRFTNGTMVDVMLPFTVSGGVLKVQGELPLSKSYPVEVYITHVALGGQEVPVKGGKFLVYKGYTTDLAAGLDFAELGLTSMVSISAVDSTGAPRSDWTVQVLYGNITAAEGRGTVNVVLPRTDVLGQPYTVRVVTDIVTPGGRQLVKEESLEVVQRSLAVQIPISTVRVVVQAVDGFGRPRDWPVAVEGFAEGRGTLEVVLLEGQRYVAKAAGLGFVNVTEFVARGHEMVVAVKIPTGWVAALVVDGFGRPRDWPVEVVGVTAGRGAVGAEVLPGRYTVKATAFGREYAQTVEVQAGQNQTVTIQVPTAILTVVPVAEDGRPLERVDAVEVVGPTTLNLTAPPRDVEVLAGQYTIRIKAGGREVTTTAALNPGAAQTVEAKIPSAGPSSQTPILIAIAAVAVAAAAVAALLKRRR